MALALTGVALVISSPVVGRRRNAPSKAVRVDSIVASRSRSVAGVTSMIPRWCSTSFLPVRKSL